MFNYFQLMVDGLTTEIGQTALKSVAQEHRPELDPVQTLLLIMVDQTVPDQIQKPKIVILMIVQVRS